jgi:hypothetical protein
MTENPYAPPTTNTSDYTGPLPPPRSGIRRASFILAASGFAVFWGAIVATALYKGPETEAAEAAAGLAVLLAVVAHLVGVGIAFGAPHGRRLAPALVNGMSLALVAALVIYGLSIGPE